jgi:hypothetical protein
MSIKYEIRKALHGIPNSTSERNVHEQLADAESQIRELQAKLEAQAATIQAVNPYIKHHFHCVWHKANCSDKCDCGLTKALDES